jgi:hypothetical protein
MLGKLIWEGPEISGIVGQLRSVMFFCFACTEYYVSITKKSPDMCMLDL